LAVVAPVSAGVLRTQVLLVLALAVGNFALQAQILRRRPTLAVVAYPASAADVLIVTALVIADAGPPPVSPGFSFPAIPAPPVASPLEVTALYVPAVVTAILGVAAAHLADVDVPTVLIRCVIVIGVALCGVLYARIEARRRARPYRFEADRQTSEASGA